MKITNSVAKRVGKSLDIDFEKFSLEQFRKGIQVELEHAGTITKFGKPRTDKLLVAGAIAYDHLQEYPDYYTRLKKVES